MSKPLFFLVAGPNGAGKSTFTSGYRRHHPFLTVVEPDAIAKELTGSSATINRVAGYRNGLLHKKAQSIPPWLSRLLHI
ncbi:hypothetical protein FKG94_13920 [Exilibacterium tricleocarpae]|uniref:UDP-N-acetylglucosamine kinase n=1 Tax=Exilibacterium tricleocarpae TaxID=2591008 RepID=A0A545TLP7_9GAMM|nr:hypothetical protein [Exilibacterium tricleocarpae]TQV78165.1 hypothetical protein FKG94_13920 [Exilibacterium tricleocarpae]